MRSASLPGAQPKADSRILRLRAAMGVRSPLQSRGKSKSGSSTIDGCRIAWEQFPASGRLGQPIVCLHSIGAGSREFRPLLDRLPTGSRLLFFDWPGHGRSGDLTGEFPGNSPLTVEYGSAILLHLLQQWGIDKPLLLGSGFGAAVAIRFAADHPERVLGLILCQPAGLIASRGGGPFAQKSNRGVQQLRRDLQKYAPDGPGKTSVVQAAMRQALRLAVLAGAMREARQTAHVSLERSTASLRAALATLAAPAFFVLSRQNREYPLQKYLNLLDPSLAWAPQHKFTVFSGAFHPLWDEPERFAQALTGFVQSQVPLENHTHAWLINAVDYPTRNVNTWKCVHPECGAERILPVGRNANESASNR